MWRRGIGRAPPRAYLQADLDLVAPPGLAPADALLCDAEAIRAVIEVGQAQHGLLRVCSRMAISQHTPQHTLLVRSSSAPVLRRAACASLAWTLRDRREDRDLQN